MMEGSGDGGREGGRDEAPDELISMHHITMRSSKASGGSLLAGTGLEISETVQQGKLHVGPEWSLRMVTLGMALNVVCVVRMGNGSEWW
eukprot:760996-Hanusia_phi.AAC.1